MKLTLTLEQISTSSTEQVGGKASALAKLQKLGYRVPLSLAITSDAYRCYLNETGLGALILMELGRKDLQQMRWEELWDASLRIRNLFLTTPLPQNLAVEFTATLAQLFANQAVVIRSSAPGEDSSTHSFAGLHDSFVNVCGRESQQLAIRKVWASLWSDRALLYRKELGLDIATSSMAVLVQELVNGEKSGVAFSCNPIDSNSVAIESVWGLNQGLVDGSVEPDFWALDRQEVKILEFRSAKRENKLLPHADGLRVCPLPASERDQPPLTAEEVIQVTQVVLALEQQLGQPQDMEWTWSGDELFLLQARPITSGAEHTDDPRSWYLSLHRGLANLKRLKERIETELIPGMEVAAQLLAEIDLQALSDRQLATEIKRRRKIQSRWEEAYRSDCIPMAHGVRLFGQFYNDAIQPQDPFAFIELLRGAEFKAVVRNRKLAELAESLRDDQQLLLRLEKSNAEIPKSLAQQLDAVAESIGLPNDLTLQLLLEMSRSTVSNAGKSNADLETAYLGKFSGENLEQAAEILAIGRASYRLRDDDNISLDKINRELQRAEQEVRSRLETGVAESLQALLAEQPGEQNQQRADDTKIAVTGEFRVRQLQGQPACPGLATGAARVIHRQQDLADFHAGEILVCDAIDPAMTFVVPLAAGIIERRGGMLIHGAIIAREYGIPCVSGIAAAAEIICTGDQITLDGYLGLVFFPPSSGKLSLAGQNAAMRKELDDATNG